MTEMKISRLSDALGAEVSGINWSRDLDSKTVEALTAAFLEHQLLCLKAEPLTPARFAAVAGHFGETQLQLIRDGREDEAPAVSRLETTYRTAADKPADMEMVRLSGWHTDDSYFQRPAKATLLQALALPDEGGETRFANAQTAYDDLTVGKKAGLAALRAVHCYQTRRARVPAKKLSAEEQAETHEAYHPLIRRHEETGLKAIYFNSNRTDRIDGMTAGESDMLLDEIHAHTSQAKYQYHHNWSVGDILLWDNRNLIHSVNMDFPVGQRRIHQRILLEGDVPVGD